MRIQKHKNWNQLRRRYGQYYYRANSHNWLSGEAIVKAVSKEKEVIHSYNLSEKELGIKYIKHCLRFLYCMPMNGKNFDFWYNEALKYLQSRIRKETATKAAKELGIAKISSKEDVEAIMLNCLRGSNIECSTMEFIRFVV